ncbi:3-oxoacyl-[acyl-carrier-protein] reductase [bacterium]|nr:3-oxoacyl-[acyl-carrier-protein] reductase [bacterium]
MELLTGKVALVTGSARGIGKTIAEVLADLGCAIVVSDIDKEGAEATAASLKTDAIAVQADVSNADDVAALVDKATERFEKIDILVNNAGITRDNLLMRMKEEDWDLVLKINLKGAFLCTKQVLRGMMRQRSGKIINIASVVGVMGNAGQANYAASKAGLIGFTKSVAREAASRNIQVNAVAPGYIETEMTSHLPNEVKENFLADIPSGRAGSGEDVAKVVAFLASSYADYITGQTIHVDGGMLIA